MNAVIFPFPAVLQLRSRIAFGDGELWAAPRGGWRCLCLLVKIVGGNAWLVHTIRHLRRRCLYTINTQQGLTSYAFGLHLLIPTVLSTIYRLRRISNFRVPNFQHTVSDGFPITDSRFSTVLSTIYRLRRISRFPVSDYRFPVFAYTPGGGHDLPSPTDSRFPVYDFD